MFTISTAPHMTSHVNTQSLMRDVVIALLPAAVSGMIIFGVGALKVILTSLAGCMLFEYIIAKYFLHLGNTLKDNSAIITGLLLAFNLPSSMPIWMILIGCFMAIVVTKMAFGGLGKNLFNPALIGRVFLFISFPVQMTHWPKPVMGDFFNTDMQTGATVLNILKHLGNQNTSSDFSNQNEILSNLPTYSQMFFGHIGGCIGEVSAFALLLGLAYLLYRKVISWHIPFYYLSTVFICTCLLWLITGNIKYDPLTHLLSGGLMLGAIFMATDYVTSPMSTNGKIFYASCCGLLTVIIRLFGSYPEGVSFAILIMNAFVPLIDKFFTPRVYGSRRN